MVRGIVSACIGYEEEGDDKQEEEKEVDDNDDKEEEEEREEGTVSSHCDIVMPQNFDRAFRRCSHGRRR